jgi:hypothetical protein
MAMAGGLSELELGLLGLEVADGRCEATPFSMSPNCAAMTGEAPAKLTVAMIASARRSRRADLAAIPVGRSMVLMVASTLACLGAEPRLRWSFNLNWLCF